ncbi:MAG: ABC transporter permease [Clostridiales Family XIII bacterium]|jgi:peptide/nickel transport system permease protein|nr:ABC transporter permease [Clostridiales Family XIII bacterium]
MTNGIAKILIALGLLTIFFFFGAVFRDSPSLPSGDFLAPPGGKHPLGTDNIGVDVLAQVSAGFFHSILIGLAAASFAVLAGGCAGIAAGCGAGMRDTVIGFVINLFLSVPQLPVMILIGAFFGQNSGNIVLIVALFSWAPIAKVVRAATMDIRGSGYMRLAVRYGGGFVYLFVTHMFRDLMPLMVINGLFVVGRAIIMEASLAFLGLADPTARSLGLMINKAVSFRGIYFTDYWKWWLMSPLMTLVVTTVLLRQLAKEVEKVILRA